MVVGIQPTSKYQTKLTRASWILRNFCVQQQETCKCYLQISLFICFVLKLFFLWHDPLRGAEMTNLMNERFKIQVCFSLHFDFIPSAACVWGGVGTNDIWPTKFQFHQTEKSKFLLWRRDKLPRPIGIIRQVCLLRLIFFLHCLE